MRLREAHGCWNAKASERKRLKYPNNESKNQEENAEAVVMRSRFDG